MPKIKSIIMGGRGFGRGGGRNSVVIDGRTLNSMAKANHFVRVHREHPYVDEQDRPRGFTWHGQRYRIEYFDGCFYPFVVKIGEVN